MRYLFSLFMVCGGLISTPHLAFANTEQTTSSTRYFALKHLTVDAKASQPNAIKDPFEPLNRKIFTFNETLDRYIAKPIAIQYQQKIPENVRGSYTSFRKNLAEPWNAVNQLIQGKPSRAAKTLGRFSVNTLTSLGFADPASRIGLEAQEESLGMTMGYYGVPSGAYIMLPILGPSTVRNTVGLAVDFQASPQKYILKHHDEAAFSMLALTTIERRAGLLDLEKTLPADKYSAIRDFYLQKQAFDIAERQGKPIDESNFIDDVDPEQDQ